MSVFQSKWLAILQEAGKITEKFPLITGLKVYVGIYISASCKFNFLLVRSGKEHLV